MQSLHGVRRISSLTTEPAMKNEKNSVPDGFVTAPGLKSVLGCSRSAVYRLIQSLQRTVTVATESGSQLEILAAPELGGLKWPESEWMFEEAVAAEFRRRLMRRARRMEKPAKG